VEFMSFEAFKTEVGRKAILDPQQEETFLRSKLDWSERDRDEHGRGLRLYQRLLDLRRTDPVWRANAGARRGLSAQANGNVLTVRRQGTAGTRILMMNFGDAPVPIDPSAAGRLPLVRSDGGPTSEPLGTLPPFTAVVVGDAEGGAGTGR